MVVKPGKYLSEINGPEDVKKLTPDQLVDLADELRTYIIQNVAKNPGHLGANLGVVELSIVLHYIYDSPNDKIVWDVGHQAYAHKILTGRREEFHTNRKYKGLSGFPKITESEHDAFGTGHSSTSISAVLGMAAAENQKENPQNRHIAVIGDGSISSGMAMEALNHVGESKANVLIILNDNGISIDEGTGAFHRYLARITASHTYNRFKRGAWRIFRNTWIQTIANKTTTALKWTWLKKSNLFEAFDIRYFGPIDGHNIKNLVEILHDLRDIPGPRLLHIKTIKGKGFKAAEKDQVTFHSPGKYDMKTGEILNQDCTKKPPKYQVVYGKTLLDLAEKNENIFAITPAMLTGSSLNIMAAKIPERTFDVGIAEQHAVTFAAGLASQGKIPFCTIYSTFLQRAYDQIIHDVALQNLPVVFGIDRGGLVGEDGPTHHGVFDLAYLRLIPNMIIAAPMNEWQLRNLMYTAQLDPQGPFAIRYPKGEVTDIEWENEFVRMKIGKGQLLKQGKDIAIISIGSAGIDAAKAIDELSADGIEISHADMIFLKPMDEELLHDICKNHRAIITVEDGTIQGGLGSAIAEFMMDKNTMLSLHRLGVPDSFVEQGSVAELKHEYGFDSEGIKNTVLEILKNLKIK
ncbi:MAG: 1-deoxy-D-xylulose-5-phosphate synthase [Bacteroidales bacterium]|nr:1-deoxy-D-xylulose-5-phosphate synthase [Bacteroidales bacterium]